MQKIFKVLVGFVLILAVAMPALFAKETAMDWTGLAKERIDLGLPLLIVKGGKGFLACGYINVETCNKTGEACAIVSGVKTHEDMLDKDVKAVSEKAKALGVEVGMTGRQALEKFK